MARDFDPDAGTQPKRLDPRSEDVGYRFVIHGARGEPGSVHRSPAVMVVGTMLSWQDAVDPNLRHHLNLAPGQRVDIRLVPLNAPPITDVHLPDEEIL